MPAPHIEVHIDFDEDKIYQADEEVKSDLKTAILTRGKNLTSNRAPASSLNMAMNNGDQKYLPINTGSPLFPFQLPGPGTRLRMAYPYDSFTDPDGTNINNRDVPAADDQTKSDPDLGAWATISNFEIRDNHVEVSSGGGVRVATMEFEVANIRLGADVKSEGGTPSYPLVQSLLTFRYADIDNFNDISLIAASAAGPFTLALYEVVAGTPGVVAATKALALEDDFWTMGTSAFLELQITGEEVHAWINDFHVGHWKGVTNQQAATRHGFGGHMISANAASGSAGSRIAQWDNFGGWNTMFNGRSDEVEPVIGDDPLANIIGFDDLERMNNHPVFKSTTPSAGVGTFDKIIDKILDGGGVLKDRGTPVGSPFAPIESVRISDTGFVINPLYEKIIGGDGLTALYQAQDDEVGFVWIDGRGTYRVEASDHRDNDPHDTALAEWEGDSTDQDKPYFSRDPRPKWKDGKDVVENEIYYRFFRATKSLGSSVWVMSIDDNPDFGHASNFGAWMKVDIVGIDASAAISDPKNPVPGTDYTIFENANGTGVDWLTSTIHTGANTTIRVADFTIDDPDGRNFMTDSWNVGAGNFLVGRRLITIEDAVTGGLAIAFLDDVPDPDGDGTRAQLTDWPEDFQGVGFPGSPGYIAKDSNFNEANALQYDIMLSGAYLIEGFEGEMVILRFLTTNTFPEDSNFLTSAILKADVTGESNPTAARAQDDASIATFGRRRIDYQTKFIDNWEIATNRAERRIDLRSGERERFTVTVKNASQRNLMEMLYRDVSDRIAINFSDMDMSSRNYWIEGYIVTISNGGKLIETTYTLSKVV